MRVRKNIWTKVDEIDGGKRDAARDAYPNFEEATEAEYMLDPSGALLVKVGSVVVDDPGIVA